MLHKYVFSLTCDDRNCRIMVVVSTNFARPQNPVTTHADVSALEKRGNLVSPFIVPVFGPLAWVDVVLLAWFTLTLVSLAYVAWDSFTNNPEMVVMKWGWLLVTLYMGPIALVLYILSCKEPAPGTHEEFIKPLWKQSVGSTIHCVAGDATGIIVAAVVTALLGLPMWLDLIIEYVAGFAFGLLIFQSLFMKDMMGGSYAKAVRHSFLPEWLSMNMMMAGMFPTMVVLMMTRDMRAMEPTELVFWGAMAAAVTVGFVTAVPINVWLVRIGLKHGMGTVRALGKGGHSREAEQARWPKPQQSPVRASESMAGMERI
jgi:hypothetical protein